MLNLPKISCLTVTNGRVDLLKKSIYCYTKQTYPNKELVLISQGSDIQNKAIQNHLDFIGRDDIIFVKAPKRLSLGGMRNLSLEIATSTIVCQWDDDDLYHPHRLMAQYKALGSGVIASLYTEHLKWFVELEDMYWCDWSVESPQWRTMLCGSIMFYKELFEKFNNRLYPESGNQSDKEEDMNVLIRLSRIGDLAPVNSGHHYIYVFHGKNVYDIHHHKLVLEKKVIGDDILLDKEKLLRQTFDSVKIDRRFDMKSLDTTAFEYEPIKDNEDAV